MFQLKVIKKNPPDTFEINHIAIVFGKHVVQYEQFDFVVIFG